jgi:hypothetical protein
MLRLRAGTATLLIGPRASAGVHGSLYCLDSETDIRQRLTVALQDPGSREAIRRFWGHWQSDFRLAGVKDQSIVDRMAHMGVRGPLIVFLLPDTSVHRRDSSASRAKQVAEAQQNQVQFKPYSGPVKSPALVTVSAVMPAATKTPTPVDRSVIAAPTKAIGDWTIAEKLTAIVVRTADSRRLSLDAQQQLKGMLSDPKFVAWLVGSLLVWFVAQFFVVGEIIDMLLAGAALVLSGAGIFFALQSLVGAAHLIGQFVEATRNAKNEADLDAAADILANIIVMIGITVLIAALTHATSRATSEGAKVSTVKRPPPERTAPVAREKILANLAESKKARTSSTKFAEHANFETAFNFYNSKGDPAWNSSRILNHIRGIDLSKPVEITEIPEGTTLVQYQVPGGKQGNYFAPPGTSASELGINPAGKVPTTFKTTEKVTALKSTAAPILVDWETPPFEADGGGTQFFTHTPELLK